MGPLASSLLQSKRQVTAKTNFGAASQHSADLQQFSSKRVGMQHGTTRYATLEREVQDVEKQGVAVVIPGLGDDARAIQVEKNLQWLKNQQVPFECWIFVYRTEQEFPLEGSRFRPCHLIRHPGYWMSHLLEMPLNLTKKPWIIHMMDGIEPQDDVNLDAVIKIMKANGLGRASPTFDTKTHPNTYIDSVYPIMARHEEIKTGRFVDFIEMHMDVFSREYFACLQDHIDTTNALGWGMDRLLPAFCGGAIGDSDVHAGRMGILDQMTMVKKFFGSYDYGEAYKGFVAFVSKHPGTPGPQFQTLGELRAPE